MCNREQAGVCLAAKLPSPSPPDPFSTALQASGGATEEELSAALSRAQQALEAERQRCGMLQAQVALAEAQGRESERMLSAQLRAVQEERNTCLAAATRADALLVRLGQHAMLTRGGGE